MYHGINLSWNYEGQLIEKGIMRMDMKQENKKYSTIMERLNQSILSKTVDDSVFWGQKIVSTLQIVFLLMVIVLMTISLVM